MIFSCTLYIFIATKSPKRRISWECAFRLLYTQ